MSSTRKRTPNSTCVGTGPFKFGDWASGDHLRLVKNPNYWETGKPALDEVIFQFIRIHRPWSPPSKPAPSTWLTRCRPRTPFAYRGSQLPRSSSVNPAAINILGVNVITAPFDKKEVRQALNYALNRKRLVDVALSGFGESAFCRGQPLRLRMTPAKRPPIHSTPTKRSRC